MRTCIARVGVLLIFLALPLFIESQSSADHDGDHLYYNAAGDHKVITRNVVLGNPIPVCSSGYAVGRSGSSASKESVNCVPT